MKFQKNNFHVIIYNAYYIFVILIFGTFIHTKKLLYKKKNSNYIFMIILGIIVDLIILPLHIILNPLILRSIAKTNKYDDKINENYDKRNENYDKIKENYYKSNENYDKSNENYDKSNENYDKIKENYDKRNENFYKKFYNFIFK